MSVRKALGWMGAAQAAFVVTQFAGSVILARLLTPYEMGVYALAASVVGMLSLIQALGLSEFVISQPKLTPRLLAGAFTVNAMLAGLLSLLVAAFALAGGALFTDPGVRRVLLVVALIPLIGALEFRPAALLKREARFKRLALINMARHLLATVATVALAYRGLSFMSLAWGQIAGATLGLVLLNLAGRRHASLAMSLAHWREITRFGINIMSINGLSTLVGRASEFGLGKLQGLDALGLFSRATSLFSLIWNNIHAAIGSVLLVDFAAELRRGGSLSAKYQKAVAMLTGLLWPAFGLLAILAGPLIHIVYGERWTGAAVALSLLCLSAIPQVAVTMAWEVFVVRQETAVQVRIELFRNAISLPLFLFGATISLEAAAAARVVDGLIAYLLYRGPLERMTGARFADFLSSYVKSGAAALAACAPAAALMAWSGWSTGVAPGLVLAAGVAGGLCWLLALKLSGHPLLEEGVAMVRARLVRRGGDDPTPSPHKTPQDQ